MKKFIIKILYYLIPFCCVFGGYKILSKSFTGDIGSLIQFPFGKKYDQLVFGNYLPNYLTIDTLVVSYEKLQVANTSKILTIGDSFSNQKQYGFQNYLGHLLGNNILNIRFKIKEYNQFTTAMALLNSEIIDSLNYKIIILQVANRDAIEKLCSIDFEMLYEIPKDIDNYYLYEPIAKNRVYDLFDFFAFIRLRLDFENPALKHNLKQDCFTHPYFSRHLFHYKYDLYFQNTLQTDIDKAKENLITLSRKFSEKGIKMIFLLAADKYDVYRPFMTDNSLPVDTIMKGLTKIPDVCVIDTKPILQEMVGNGELDVYLLHDTHWSYKGSEAIARELLRYIHFFISNI